MRGHINTTGINENASFALCPEGEHWFEISETEDATTKNGDPMVKITLKGVDPESTGSFVWDNIVIPLPNSPSFKIMGRTKHFLHCIGEPYEGEVEFDSDRWIGRKALAFIRHEEYRAKDQSIKTKAVIVFYTMPEAGQEAPDGGVNGSDPIPF